MSFRSEWDDIKRAFWGVVMLPWVVVRDLGKMAWEAVVRKRDYADRRHEMLDDTMARPIERRRGLGVTLVHWGGA